MKLRKTNHRSAAATVRLLSAIAACLLIPMLLIAAAPQWWTDRGITNSKPANDYAAANQGQLKNIAKAAMQEMDDRLPGGAGDTLHTLVAGWTTPAASTNDYAAVNLGQLKTVAKPFYDRLIAVGYTTGYPWTSATTDDNDYAIANVGQLKQIFAFEVDDSIIISPLFVSGLTATPGDGQVTVSWFPCGDSFTYTLQRSTSPGSGYVDFVGNITSGTSLTNTGLTNGTQYFYRIKASDGAINGYWSSQVSATPGVDTDGDGMPDWWESLYGLTDPNANPDGDAFTNLQEFQMGTNPGQGAVTATSSLISLVVFNLP